MEKKLKLHSCSKRVQTLTNQAWLEQCNAVWSRRITHEQVTDSAIRLTRTNPGWVASSTFSNPIGQIVVQLPAAASPCQMNVVPRAQLEETVRTLLGIVGRRSLSMVIGDTTDAELLARLFPNNFNRGMIAI
jgi:hypothetical protein